MQAQLFGHRVREIGQVKNALGTLLIVRVDGIQERLQGAKTLPLFESDRLVTEANDQALIEFGNGTQVALNGGTEFSILQRWEKDNPMTRILRLKHGEIWVKTNGPQRLEIETPVANARVKGTEFDIKVKPDGQTTLRVIKGVVEFGTAFGTCPIKTDKISFGVRGKKCTKPKSEEHQKAISWTKNLLG